MSNEATLYMLVGASCLGQFVALAVGLAAHAIIHNIRNEVAALLYHHAIMLQGIRDTLVAEEGDEDATA